MKQSICVVLFLFFFFVCILSGCTDTSSESHPYDSRLIGQWKNEKSLEVLEFFPDGTYFITEAEMEDWYTEPGGRLWMYGTLYSYTLSENNMMLNITGDGYSWILRKIL